MEFLGFVLILIAANLFVFAIMKIIIYCGREKLKKSEELRKKAKDDFVNCLNCKHFRCRCVNTDDIHYENEYCYICELSGKILPYNTNEERNEMLIHKDWCPLINKERKNEK